MYLEKRSKLFNCLIKNDSEANILGRLIINGSKTLNNSALISRTQPKDIIFADDIKKFSHYINLNHKQQRK